MFNWSGEKIHTEKLKSEKMKKKKKIWGKKTLKLITIKIVFQGFHHLEIRVHLTDPDQDRQQQ